jgi:O-antigen/teichoic acid export membrane protein
MLSELKKLGKHTIIYGTGMLLGKAIGFFLIPLYTHYLTPKDYGILELIDLTGFVLGYLMGLGIDQAVLRYYNITKKKEGKDEVLSTALIFAMLFGLFIVSILLPASKILSRYILDSTQYTFLFLLLFVNLFLGSILGLAKTALRAQEKSISYTAISLIYTVIAVCLNIYFIAIAQLGIKGILYSTLITSMLLATYLAVQILKESGLKFRVSRLKEMLKYSMPFVPNGILAFILNWSDRYILRIYCDMETIGLYALGYKMGMIIVFLIASPFNLIWNAYIFEVQNRSDARQIYARFATYFLLLLCSAGLAISVFARELIIIISHPSYLNAYKVIPLIVLSMIFMCSDNVFQVGLLVKGKSGYLPVTRGLAAVANVALNFFLIPRYGMLGAAWATAISFFVCAVVILYIAQKIYYINFEFIRLLKLTLAAIIVFQLSSFVSSDNLWLTIVIKFGILCLFPIFLYVFKFLNTEETVFLKDRLKILHHFVFQNSRKYL